MGLELEEVSLLLERAEEEGDADTERALMENALSMLCHSGIVYPDSHGLLSDGFEWIQINQNFIGKWFDARGDRFDYDEVLRMAYVTSRNPTRKGPGVFRPNRDEMLVGCALRATYDRGLMEGEDGRVATDVSRIQTMFRSVFQSDAVSVPGGRRIDSILATFKDHGCVRIGAGPISEERPVTVLPGIRVLFSNEYLARVSAELSDAEGQAGDDADALTTGGE